MSTVTQRELTTKDAVACALELEKMAIATFLQRPRVTEGMVRAYLSENHQGTPTARTDFDEAVRRYLMSKWEIQ